MQQRSADSGAVRNEGRTRRSYRTGYYGRTQFAGRKFDDVERDLELSYNRAKGASMLGWRKAKYATRAAWDRIERSTSGNSDRR